MRVVLQRVSRASVSVDGEEISSIGRGLLLLVGIGRGDDEEKMAWIAEKCVNLRIFPDEDAKMNRSLLEIGGEVLAVSQFTLLGDVRKGRRPSFVAAASPEEAAGIFDRFVELIGRSGLVVKKGVFGAMMDVELVNDGPVTIILEK